MQHLTVADKSVLIGDEVADAPVRYAAHPGRTGSAGTLMRPFVMINALQRSLRHPFGDVTAQPATVAGCGGMPGSPDSRPTGSRLLKSEQDLHRCAPRPWEGEVQAFPHPA